MTAAPEPTRKRNNSRRDRPVMTEAVGQSIPVEGFETPSAFDPTSQSSPPPISSDPASQSSAAASSSTDRPPTPLPDQPTSPVARTDYSNDAAAGTDRLGIGRDVDALAYLIAARDVVPPLSIGLFGDWGSGKTFFMGQLKKRVEKLAAAGKGRNDGSPFYQNVIQIDFNAWHYIEANLWASLAIRVFEGLTSGLMQSNKATDELEQKLRKSMEASSANMLAAEALRTATEQQVQDARAGRARALNDLQNNVSQVLSGGKNLSATAEVLSVDRRPGPNQDIVDQLKSIATLRDIPGLLQATWRRFRGLPANELATVVGAGVVLIAGGIAVSVFAQSVGPVLATLVPLALAAAALIRSVANTAGALADAAQGNDDLKRALSVHRDATSRLRNAQADFERAQAALAELQKRVPEMYRFVRERYTSLDYQKALGIVALIQRDFDNLSRLLHKTGPDGSAPQVERIVLYIDDLDRCPPEVVVKVLQAVHLLLAFPLFVVVVAVDSRWLLASLKAVQRAAWMTPSKEAPDETQDEDPWATTPQSYLEKIFQIPFWIRPMSVDGFATLVRSLTSTGAEDGLAAGEDAATEIPMPQLLELKPVEISSMQLMAPLITTPRATKRFVNIYRLLRAGVSDAEMPTFVGDQSAVGGHRAVVLLLAVMVGFPQLSGELFSRLDGSTRGSWSEFMSGFEGDADWRDLLNAIGRLAGGPRVLDLPGGLLPYRHWAPIVARYSFEAGRIIPVLNQTTNGSPRAELGMPYLQNDPIGGVGRPGVAV